MCDHCSTYKPLLNQKPGVPHYPTTGPSAYPVTAPVGSAIGSGCCTWMQDCCGGGCCTGIGCCAPPEPILDPARKPPFSNGYQMPGNCCNQPANVLPPAMGTGPVGENEARVQCVTTKKEPPQLPKCYGGDCQDSSEHGSGVVSKVESVA